LVAEAFLGYDPSTKYVINHKNGDKQDNDVKNLEICTRSENTLHAYKNGLSKWSRKVAQYDKDGNFIKEYPSIAEGARAVGRSTCHLAQVCDDKYKSCQTCAGYIWKYA